MEKVYFGGQPILFNKLTIEPSPSQTSKKVRIYMNIQNMLFSETVEVPMKSSQFYRSLSNKKKTHYLSQNSIHTWPATIFVFLTSGVSITEYLKTSST